MVSKDKTVIDLGTLTDEYEKELTIHTTATGADGEKSIIAGKEVTIIGYRHLRWSGSRYKVPQLKGWQMVKDENAELLIDGEPVQSDYSFTGKKGADGG